MKNKKPKILLFDLESSYIQGVMFGLFDQNIAIDNIMQDWHLFSIAWKWHGQKTIHAVSLLNDPKRFKKDIHDDYHIINEFRKVLEEADAIVAHNLSGFDIKMFQARLIMHNLPPLPKFIHIDTLTIAKKYFRFTSNKLDYLAQQFGHDGKIHNPRGLWLDCFKGNRRALQQMVRYNKVDIEALEVVFERFMPYVKNNALNMGMFLDGARCPNPICGSTDLMWRGFNKTRTNKYRKFVCKACGSWSDERMSYKADKVDIK